MPAGCFGSSIEAIGGRRSGPDLGAARGGAAEIRGQRARKKRLTSEGKVFAMEGWDSSAAGGQNELVFAALNLGLLSDSFECGGAQTQGSGNY